MSAEVKTEAKNQTTLLPKIKLLLRLEANDSTFDNEVNMLIDSCKSFLISAGIPNDVVNNEEDQQITDTIGQYCKIKFGYSNQNNNQELPQSFWFHVNQLRLGKK